MSSHGHPAITIAVHCTWMSIPSSQLRGRELAPTSVWVLKNRH